MKRNDWIALLTFVLGVGGGIYWRTHRQETIQPKRDCSQGCTTTIEEPVWCKTPDGRFIPEGVEVVLDDDEAFRCARMDTWTVMTEESKP